MPHRIGTSRVERSSRLASSTSSRAVTDNLTESAQGTVSKEENDGKTELCSMHSEVFELITRAAINLHVFERPLQVLLTAVTLSRIASKTDQRLPDQLNDHTPGGALQLLEKLRPLEVVLLSFVYQLGSVDLPVLLDGRHVRLGAPAKPTGVRRVCSTQIEDSAKQCSVKMMRGFYRS